MTTRLEFLAAQGTTDPAGELLIFQGNQVNRINSGLLSAPDRQFARLYRQISVGDAIEDRPQGQWSNYSLNTLSGDFGTLAAPGVALAAGTYAYSTVAPTPLRGGAGCISGIRLYNNTASAVIASFLESFTSAFPPGVCQGQFTLASESTIYLQRYNGGGGGVGFAWTAAHAAITSQPWQVIFEKLA